MLSLPAVRSVGEQTRGGVTVIAGDDESATGREPLDKRPEFVARELVCGFFRKGREPVSR